MEGIIKITPKSIGKIKLSEQQLLRNAFLKKTISTQMKIIIDGIGGLIKTKLENYYKKNEILIEVSKETNGIVGLIKIKLLKIKNENITKSHKDYKQIKESFKNNIEKIKEELKKLLEPAFGKSYRNSKMEVEYKTEVKL